MRTKLAVAVGGGAGRVPSCPTWLTVPLKVPVTDGIYAPMAGADAKLQAFPVIARVPVEKPLTATAKGSCTVMLEPGIDDEVRVRFFAASTEPVKVNGARGVPQLLGIMRSAKRNVPET